MNELSVSRFIAAPPATVWDAMVNRQPEWWCPRPWSVEIIAQDRFAGGRSAMIMRGPDGEEMPQEGIMLLWDEGRRFASTDAIVGDLEPAGPFMIGIWEVEPEGEGTRYTARARHWSADACRQHEEMGFVQGWEACAAQLAELCETM
ncbi:SRPBCC domain-containing protein [Erythrobacter sp. R86502]|uniref:SRPBCC domain-containing protein n=1 Tax=Erythrobacter sp. R86502 TaxID=3093846 RepID=UPI0036D22454